MGSWKFPFQRLTNLTELPRAMSSGFELTHRIAVQGDGPKDGLHKGHDLKAAKPDAATQTPVYFQSWAFLVLWCGVSVMISYADRTNISIAILNMQKDFKWDEKEKGLILSVFFIGYALTQFMGGRLADLMGGKKVLACGLSVWSLCTFLTPITAKAGVGVLLINRIALGMGEGVGFPAIHSMISKNVPSRYQSTAVGIVTAASYTGTVFAYTVSPWITDKFGWEAVFFGFGTLAVLWLPPWMYMNQGSHGCSLEALSGKMRKSSETSAERPGDLYGYSSLFPGSERAQNDTGIFALIKTKPFIAMCTAMYCQAWGLFTLINWLPTFFSEKYAIRIKDVGWYTVLPYIMQAIIGSVSGIAADSLLARKWSVKTVRRLFQSFGMFGPAACLTLAVSSFAPASAVLGSVLFTIGMGFDALSLAGVSVTHLDFAPNHAGAIFGVSSTISTTAGFGVYVAGWLLNETHSWGWVFGVTAVHYIVGIIVWIAWVGDSPLPQDRVANTFSHSPDSN